MLTVRRGSVHVEGSVGDRATRRLASLPERCHEAGEPGPASDPIATSDVFWQAFTENHPFFTAKGVDRNVVRASHPPRVHTGTTEAELFAVFEEMLAPPHDAHVHLSDGASRFFGEGRPGTTIPTLELENRVKAYIQEVDLGGRTPQEFAEGRISYADLPDGRGYLRLSGFGGCTESGDFDSESTELNRAWRASSPPSTPPACAPPSPKPCAAAPTSLGNTPRPNTSDLRILAGRLPVQEVPGCHAPDRSSRKRT
ncbi:hypothetical protein ACIQV3_26105, partial [Streptomyces sp. NPDC099050]